MTSFYLDCPWKGPVSRDGHVLRCWVVVSIQGFGRDTVQPTTGDKVEKGDKQAMPPYE